MNSRTGNARQFTRTLSRSSFICEVVHSQTHILVPSHFESIHTSRRQFNNRFRSLSNLQNFRFRTFRRNSPGEKTYLFFCSLISCIALLFCSSDACAESICAVWSWRVNACFLNCFKNFVSQLCLIRVQNHTLK